jgi:hypothetical protein
MLGSGTRRIPVNTACPRSSRHSRATERGSGWGMPANEPAKISLCASG